MELNYKSNIDSVQKIYFDGVSFEGDSLLWFYTYVARSSNYSKDFDLSRSIIDKHLSSVKTELLDPDLRIEIYLLTARTKYLMGDKLEAVEMYQKALLDPELSIHDKASTHINYSIVFWDLGYFEQYKIQCELAYEAATEAKDSRRQIIALRNLAEYHETISHDFDEAKKLYLLAESLKGENPQLETDIRLRIQRARQLSEFEHQYELADSLLLSAKIEAQESSLNSLYESANWALMRTRFLKQEYIKKQRQHAIQYTLAALLLLGLLTSFFLNRKNPNWNKISSKLKSEGD